MNAPLYLTGAFDDGAALAIALVLGIAFGWFLERGGMGSARRIAAQFYLTDLAVFKIMFSAILTTLLGLFWLGRAGWVDLSLLGVPETYILPAVAGGLVFGIGFVMGGLCPGTSCVSAATGRIDGIVVLLGMMAGIAGFGFAYPLLESFYTSTARGVLTLPQAFGLQYGTLVAIVVAAGLGGFLLADRIERAAPHRMRFARPLGTAAAVLGFVAIFAGAPTSPGARALPDRARITARDVAERIRDRTPMVIIDARDPDAFEGERLPLALNLPLARLSDPDTDIAAALAIDPATPGPIVVYAQRDGDAVMARMLLAARGLSDVLVLDGGITAWQFDVLEPILTADATDAEREAFAAVSELSRWFGGSPRTGVDPVAIIERARLLEVARFAAGPTTRRARRGCGL